MDYVVIIMFTWGVYKIVTRTPREIINQMNSEEGFITAKSYLA